MKRLSVQIKHLRDRFESHTMWAPELAIVDHLEKLEWKNKTPGGKKVLDIHQLGLEYGAEFAFTALQIAEPKALANQIARFICIDVALAGLDAHPRFEKAFSRRSLTQLADFIGKNGDLSAWEGWAAAMRDGFRNSHSEVYDRIYGLFVAPLHGRDPNSDWEEGGLNGLLDAADDLCFVLLRSEECYREAERIADLAKDLETEWQNGTRLEFEFIGKIEQAMEDLEDRLAPANRQRALGRMWSSWVFRTTGEGVRPYPPTPLVDMAKIAAGQPE